VQDAGHRACQVQAAFSLARNRPVDSITMSAPSAPQSIAAGSRLDRTVTGFPSMLIESAEQLPPQL